MDRKARAQSVQQLRNDLATKLGELRTRASEVKQDLDIREHVRKKPWVSVGLAFTTGFALARLRSPIGRVVAPLAWTMGHQVSSVLAQALLARVRRRLLDDRSLPSGE